MAKQQVHTDVSKEISTQLAALNARRDEIVRERAEIFKRDGFPEPEAGIEFQERDRAIRGMAKRLLNGHGSAIPDLPVSKSRERELRIEQEAIEMAIGVLTREDLAQRATRALRWQEKNAQAWQTQAREFVLAALNLERMANRARALFDGCPDKEVISFPLAGYITRHATQIDGMTLHEFALEAVERNFVTPNEVAEVL